MLIGDSFLSSVFCQGTFYSDVN